MADLSKKVGALQLSLEGLIKLLGSNPERYFEIVKGLTTPAEFKLASTALDAVTANVNVVKKSIEAVHEVAAKAMAKK